MAQTLKTACSIGGRVRSLGQEDPLEKGMATHFSILAWETPCTEEPGELHPWGGVRHNLATNKPTLARH